LNGKKNIQIGKKEGLYKPDFDLYELYAPSEQEAFALAPTDVYVESWVDKNYKILDEKPQQSWHKEKRESSILRILANIGISRLSVCGQ